MAGLSFSQRLWPYIEVTRLNRPIGSWLLLWPTWWALWLASEGVPDWSLWLIFTVGTVLMRSAGCAINDYADRDFDRHVKRTAHRPVTSGRLSPRSALVAAIVLALVAATLLYWLNNLVRGLAVVAVLIAASYPYMKRWIALPQAYLGVAFGFGIPMAYAAVLGYIPFEAWVLLVANIFWTIAYDTEYAMVDRDDDLKIGIRTSAITFGRWDVAAVMISYAIALGLMLAIGWRSDLGPAYFLGLAVAAGIAAYHWTLIRNRDRANCFKAFLHNTWLGAAIWLGLAIDFAWKSA